MTQQNKEIFEEIMNTREFVGILQRMHVIILMLSESRFYHFWLTVCMIFLLSFLRLVDMVHQDLLLAHQYSKLKVSDVNFSLISCIGNDDELRLWLNYSNDLMVVVGQKCSFFSNFS
jgi:hypothetical protein